MRQAKGSLRPPILPNELEPTEITSLHGLDLEQCRLDACSLSKKTGEHTHFDGVRVVGGALDETKLAHLTWLDVHCERCNLAMIDWPGAKFLRVEIRDCRLTGAKLIEGELDNVRFAECQLDYASFSGTRFRRVSFEQCRLKEADFSGADLTGTSFIECNLQGIDLTGAKLHGADVSSSSLIEVRVRPEDVRGLVVNREQAAVLSQLFGLVLRDG
jgi:uncharacterized protein YjbI with pentapeptide repeats